VKSIILIILRLHYIHPKKLYHVISLLIGSLLTHRLFPHNKVNYILIFIPIQPQLSSHSQQQLFNSSKLPLVIPLTLLTNQPGLNWLKIHHFFPMLWFIFRLINPFLWSRPQLLHFIMQSLLFHHRLTTLMETLPKLLIPRLIFGMYNFLSRNVLSNLLIKTAATNPTC